MDSVRLKKLETTMICAECSIDLRLPLLYNFYNEFRDAQGEAPQPCYYFPCEYEHANDAAD